MQRKEPFSGDGAPLREVIVSMIGLIGRDSFITDLARLIEQNLGLDHFHIFLYRERSAPAVLVSTPQPTPYPRGLMNYVQYTYVINPAYRAYRMGNDSGVFLISDFLKNDGASVMAEHDVDVHIEKTEPIGYRTPGWPRNMAEIIVLINLPNLTALDLSFMTPLGSRQTQQCQELLEEVFPYLDAAFQRQFALNPSSLDAEDTMSAQEDRFDDFGGDVLTVREREVAQLILIGHSSNSISLMLGISLPTVKTHRRNIYSKLHISSQAELFNLFLLHLK